MNIIKRIMQLLRTIKPDIPIYRENQKGGFQEPSFYVLSIGDMAQPELFNRQLRTHSFQVVYFPSPDHPNADMENMKHKLLDSFLVLDDFATIRNREFTPSDGTLTMTFDVVIRAYPEDLTPQLESLNYEGGVAIGNDQEGSNEANH